MRAAGTASKTLLPDVEKIFCRGKLTNYGIAVIMKVYTGDSVPCATVAANVTKPLPNLGERRVVMATSSIFTNIEIKDAEAAERLLLALEKSEEMCKRLPPITPHRQNQEAVDEVIRRLKEKYA